jgi:hypothetical protein
MGRCTLNNKSMQSLRRDPVYQAVMLDLAYLGVIDAKALGALVPGGASRGIIVPGITHSSDNATEDVAALLKKTEED